jgi:TRAP-type mannitol/chloroaromatic compound transport system substrate-binding protein
LDPQSWLNDTLSDETMILDEDTIKILNMAPLNHQNNDDETILTSRNSQSSRDMPADNADANRVQIHRLAAERVGMEDYASIMRAAVQAWQLSADSSLSPNGRFGFHVQNDQGFLPQMTTWMDTWDESFAQLLSMHL